MTMRIFSITAAISLAATGLTAQQGGEMQVPIIYYQSAYQNASTLGAVISPVGGRGQLVTGSPLSAREVNKTVQTLGDGTVLENTQTTLFYRDSQGRTRIERGDSNGPVTIVDPVAAVRITIDPSTKTAFKMDAPGLAAARGGTSGARLAGSVETALTEAQRKLQTAKMQAEAGPRRPAQKNQSATEDLGFQNQNGVLAQGTRTTLTIPQGQIGNNRDIHVVNERWYSEDLQMVVKTVNTDPRYGVTTYELTNISMNAPDPTLFQIPTGYTVTEGPAGRGGRGGR